MLKKDLIELCLLHLLSQGDQYGYELLRRLHDAFPDTQESAVYAILRGLCREGCSEQYTGQTSDGPARKYYRLTDSGTARYGELLRQWRTLLAALGALGIN
ncbi:MAG: PadR family transcriptional regulator [Oscillospiraceae bacterium]|nr:PadR family transcriptional regulator [Oscillospiraceae bacterium]